MAHQPVYRPRPALVRQREIFSCWAAALESWLSVAAPNLHFDEGWAMEACRAWMGEDSRLEWQALRQIARLFSMEWEEVGPGALTPEYLSSKLAKGPLYMAYIPTPGPVAAHVVVVYGISPAAVQVADPYEGYLTRPFEFFRSRRRAFVAWPGYSGAAPDPAYRLRGFEEAGGRNPGPGPA